MVPFQYSDILAATVENHLHNVALKQSSIHGDHLPLQWDVPQ